MKEHERGNSKRNVIGKEIRKSRKEGFRGDFGIEEGKRTIREGKSRE